jgi:SAM-dependent methyltransferase
MVLAAPIMDGWQTKLDRIDRLVASAGSGYLQELRQRGERVDTAAWSRELDLLARGRNVDYALPGLPLMYAIRYMPKRIIALLGELSELSLEEPPRSVLDVGVGTGAVPAAIQMLWPVAATTIAGIDASPEMLRFAAVSQRDARKPASFSERTLEDLMGDRALLRNVDLVTFSAPFNRAFAEWDRLARALRAPSRRVFATEPSSRSYLLDSFELALRAEGWATRRGTSDTIPAAMREVRELPAVTRFWRRIGSPGPYQPQTWWEPPHEQFLFAVAP